MSFALTLIALAVCLGLTWRYLGSYMVSVYAGRVSWLSWVERPTYRLLGVDPDREQGWQRYTAALLVFSAISILLTYGLLRLQASLPLNPQHLPAVSPGLAWNTAVSFVTNTNWQNYSGESTMTYFSQMVALTVQNFVSPAVGLVVAIAVIRGFSRRSTAAIGNFWVDLVRSVLYILLPIAFIVALVFVAQGSLQTLAGPAHIHDPLNGVTQTIPRLPLASQEVIKQLGTNGGGPFNANGAHPYENPTGLTNFLSILLVLAIPVALTYTFGKMVGQVRQGAAVLAAMTLLFGAWLAVATTAEQGPNPAVAAGGLVHQPGGNVAGKEARFGVASSALYAIASTQTSTGSIDGANDSYTPLGGLALMAGMAQGETTPGGVGSGLYTILLSAIVTVFIGGLMVGRTPEYLGKKIQAREVKLAAFGVLVMPVSVLVLTGIASAIPAGTHSVLNHGPQGFSEIFYALLSQGNNNGSAFAGLNGNTPFYNLVGGIDMLIGRFGIIVPALALAGVLAKQATVPVSAGTFRTDTPMFVGLLVGVILLVGALTFFPAVSLGPLVQQFSHGRLF
ncbi:MAG TPA: potassium-transporting ATPase subunit KdpA [Verrucomicrobiae bacterium]|nr:potassium-transporting ATPase subunit KdpA [Verrucomicrobiae bacterium]